MCVGVEVESTAEVFTIGFNLGGALMGEDVGVIPEPEISYGTVVYWPGIAWPERDQADQDD